MVKDGFDRGKSGDIVLPEILAGLRAAAEFPADRVNTDDVPEVVDWLWSP